MDWQGQAEWVDATRLFGDILIEIAEKDDAVVLVTADSFRIAEKFVNRFPDRSTENVLSRLPQCQLKVACDINTEEAREWLGNRGILNFTPDYRDVIKSPEIDVVLICSPTPTHVDYIVEAANAGKHIFCEKPVDLSAHRIAEAIAATRQNGVKLQVGFMKRFDREYARVREMILDGSVGEQYIIRIASRDADLPSPEYVKQSGGLFQDMTCHDFDTLRYMSGSEVAEVFALADARIAGYFRDVDDYDTAIVSFRLNNGAIGSIDNSRKTTYGYDQRVEIFGSEGCVLANNVARTNVTMLSRDGTVNDKPKDWFIDRYSHAYVEEIKHFLEAILHDHEPLVTGIDALKAVLIATAAQQSIAETRLIRVDYSMCW